MVKYPTERNNIMLTRAEKEKKDTINKRNAEQLRKRYEAIFDKDKNRKIPGNCPLCKEPTNNQNRCSKCGLYLAGKLDEEIATFEYNERNGDAFHLAVSFATGLGTGKNDISFETYKDMYLQRGRKGLPVDQAKDLLNKQIEETLAKMKK